MFEKYKKAPIILLVHSVANFGGANKSIYNFWKYQNSRDNEIPLIDKSSRFKLIKLLLIFFLQKKVLINGLASFNSPLILIYFLFNRRCIFYPHETEYAFNSFKKRSPFTFKILKYSLTKRNVAVVSEKQLAFLKNEFGTKNAIVLYENILINPDLKIDKVKINIVMIAYYSERKGVSFYSQLADYSKEKNPEIQFHWIGSGEKNGLYFSENVIWHPEAVYPQALLNKFDLFFLASVDDPFPLVCLEALSCDIPVVAYSKTGTAEIIDAPEYGTVYHEYTLESAYNAIMNTISRPRGGSKTPRDLYNKYGSIESFYQRFDKILEL